MHALFQENTIESIFLAEITIIEFISAIAKKTRTKELNLAQADLLVSSFEKDLDKYEISPQSEEVLRKAALLIRKYRQEGLRALDALQLATAVALKETIQLNKTFDRLLVRIRG